VNPLDELTRVLPKPPADQELPRRQLHKAELLTIIAADRKPRRAPRNRDMPRWLAPVMAAAAVAVIVVLAVAVPTLVGVGSGGRPTHSPAPRGTAPLSAGATAPPPTGSALTTTRRWSVPAARFDSVSVSVARGSVTVVGGRASSAAITASPRYGGQAPALSSQVIDDTLIVTARCPTEPRCQVLLTLQVPAGVSVRARSGLGIVRVTGLHGGVIASASDGDIALTDLSGRVAASSELGDVTLKGLSGQVTASTGNGAINATDLTAAQVALSSQAGNVTAAFSVAPEHVTASSQMGNVVLRLPETVPYDVTASTQLGSTSIKLPRSSGSGHVVKASSQLGSVTVTGV
jgi:hypothetical protein